MCSLLGLAAPLASAQLEEVIVVAQKRTESITDLPLSITAVQSDTLENVGIDSISNLSRVVTGLRVDSSGAFVQPTIRGVGSAIAGTGFGTNVATYVDGFYNPNQLSTDSMFINIDSVEVLKGPQGTLFGRNATGGAILIRLREPSQEAAFKARAAYGRFDTRELSVYGSHGLTDNSAIDISVAHKASDGFTDNIVTGESGVDGYESTAARTTAVWSPTDILRFKLAMQYTKIDDGRPFSTSVEVDPTGPSSQGAFYGGLSATRRGKSSAQTDTIFKAENYGFFLTTNIDLGFAELVSYTQYLDDENESAADWDASSVHIFEGRFFHDTQTLTQEFNLTGEIGQLQYTTGLYYFDSSDTQRPFPVLLGGFGPVDFYDSSSDVQSWSVFADGTYQLTDNWALIAGLRYSDEKADAMYAFGEGTIIASGGAIPAELAGVPVRFDGNWDDVSGRLGIQYSFDIDTKVYFMYSEGYKAGLLTPNSFETTPLKPEELSAYEIGFKYSGRNNRFDAAIFYYDYQDLQVANYVAGAALYRNAASSTIQGADVQWTSLLTPALQLNLGVSYVDAKYDDFDEAPAFIRDLRPTIDGQPNGGYGGFYIENVDAGGAQMQRSPEWTVNLGLQYTTPLAGGELTAFANYYYSSKFPWDNVGLYMEEAYNVLDLRVAWTDPSSHWEFGIYGRNVLDEEYRSQVLPQPPSIQQTFGAPATWGVDIAYSF